MELPLQLPEPAPDKDISTIPASPNKIKKWLESLPMANAVEASHEVHKTLMMLNRIPIDADDRLKIMELLREPVRLIAEKLQQSYADLPLPLPEKHQLTAEQVRHFHVEMAYGYKHVIQENYLKLKSKLTGRRAARIALPIQRAIRYLTAILTHSYQFYAPYPVGTWREIHLLYRLAESTGITGMPVDDALNLAVQHSSIDHVYKQALLTDLSDPYHLPARMILKIAHYLDLMAPLARLAPTPDANIGENCQFLVDLGSDRAGQVYIDNSQQLVSKSIRLLSTLELARNIHSQLTALQNNKKPPDQGLGGSFYDPLAREMLMRLINTWGVNPKRVFQRKMMAEAQIQAAFGLDASVHFINGEKPLLCSSEFMGPFQQRTRIGTLYAMPDQAISEQGKTSDIDTVVQKESGPAHTISTWDVLDDSAGGLAAEKASDSRVQVRVGEIIIFKPVGSQKSCSIGSVRWMRNTGPESMEVGVQRMAPTGVPVKIKTLSEQGMESDFMSAIILPALPALKQAQSLIAPRGTFRVERAIYMDDGRSLRRAIATKLLEVTGSYERFEFITPEFD